jgi:phenylacetate-CoA ligase
MKKLYSKIYQFSPIWIQNIIISIYGFLIYKQRYGKVYYKTFNSLINKDYSNYEEELKNQTASLKIFLRHAVAESPFYRELYKNISISRINSIEDLKILPIVDKEMLRQNIEQVYTINEKAGLISFTGGTTGKSLKVIYTKYDFQNRMAYLDAFKYKLGIDTFKSKKATFSGRELTINPKSKIFWRYNFIYKQRLYSTFDLTEANMNLYINDLNKFKPDVLNGFVSAIYELAGYIDRNKCELKFKPKAIFTTSETLLTVHRELIERVFDTTIYNQYASAEGAPFITECTNGNLHYNLDTGVIETVSENSDEMIVTSFTTYGTPLIRYNIGDLITFKKGHCTCGSSHPLVEKIDGRKVDYLISKTKGKISLSHLADVIKGNPNSIKKMQFIQDSINDVKVNIVVDESLYIKEHENMIIKEMKYRFGHEATIIVNKVDDILREKSGKFSIIKNNIKS